jgi:Zn-dependent protease with chaperone function
MTRLDARQFQVALTGTRLAPCTDEELLVRLRNRFKLSDAQGAAMLKGTRIVKRGIDAASARTLVAVLGELGLEAVAQEVAVPSAAPRAKAPDVPQRVASPAATIAFNRAPGPATHAAPAAPRQEPPRKAASASLDALRALADQRLPKPRTSFTYMVGLLLITLLCVAVPAVYLGFTGAITYGWFWYLTHIHHHLPRYWQLIVFIYTVPVLGGAMLVLFLLRPLFAAGPRAREAPTLDPEKEAGFVSGVHALCRAIGVSPPAEIRLSWDANASVRFRSGLSVFTGEKVLTIGLSLISGLSARQFVGVLAHEFGHFAQRFGMRCSFLVNSVNRWLEHCAYGEDAWSTRLRDWTDDAAEKEGWFSSLVGLSSLVALVAIALTRRLMALLFHVSLGLSRYMSRQMEFDADRYEALLAGSDAFRGTASSLRALNHAFEEVNSANIEAWQEQRLLRNLPEAVAAHAREFDATRLAKIEHEIHGHTATRYWDSHPPDVERIDNAEKRRAPGIYLDEAPAALLFKDFAGWSQRATRQFYAEQGVRCTDDQLRSRDEIMGHVRGRGQQREQINRFFNGQFQGWPLLQLATQGRADAAQLGWQHCIDGIRARSPEIARHWLQAFQAHERRRVLRAAVRLGASSRQVGLPGADRSAEELGAELENIAARRLPFCKPLEEAFALYALRIDHAIRSMPEAERGHAARMRDTLAVMGALEPEVSALEELGGAMGSFMSIAQASGEMPAGFDKLESAFSELASQVLVRSDRVPQSVTADGTLGAYLRACCPEVPAAGKEVASAEFARAAWRVPTAFHHLYMLALGELVDLCERAERARGIRPIRLVA